REIVDRVRGTKASDADVDALIQRFADDFDKDAIAKRIRKIAPTVPTELREPTFRIAMDLAFIDHELHGDEDELLELLAECLAITPDRADRIAEEARRAAG